MKHLGKLPPHEPVCEFARIGQLYTASLHELSNHVTLLTLAANSLIADKTDPTLGKDVRDSINSINDIILQTRDHLSRSITDEPFDPEPTIAYCVKKLQAQPQVSITYRAATMPPDSDPLVIAHGNSYALYHVLTILGNNALEAVKDRDAPSIIITSRSTSHSLYISIADNGKGVPPSRRPSLFLPTASTKHKGHSIGLYLAQCITIRQLHGEIQYIPYSKGGKFELCLPRERRSFSLPQLRNVTQKNR